MNYKVTKNFRINKIKIKFFEISTEKLGYLT